MRASAHVEAFGVTQAEATEFLRPAVDASLRIWADLGAGSGTFTRALAMILDAGSTIYEVENDPALVRKLREVQRGITAAAVVPILSDLRNLDDIAELALTGLDAALLANVLHYFANPADVLRAISTRLRPGGRIVLAEYDRSSSNQWVPYPIPAADVPRLAAAARLSWHGVLADRKSRYQGRLYCGFFTTRGEATMG
jgi:SAM-dependent methyltransferase